MFRSVTISFSATVFNLILINSIFVVNHCGICGVATSQLAVDRFCTYNNINNNCELKATLKSKLLSIQYKTLMRRWSAICPPYKNHNPLDQSQESGLNHPLDRDLSRGHGYPQAQGPVSRTSRNFSGDINPFVSSTRTRFKL